MDLQQKAREALVSNFNEDTAGIILSLTWHDLGIDSDAPVFLIGHPKQTLPVPVWAIYRVEEIATETQKDMTAGGWRRTVQ